MKEVSIEIIISLVIGWFFALFIEKKYIGRVAQLVIALDGWFLMGGGGVLNAIYEKPNFSIIGKAWEEWDVHVLIKWYLVVGIVIGIVGFLSYAIKTKMSQHFYELTHTFFSSKTMMPISTAFVACSRLEPNWLYKAPFWFLFIFLWLFSWHPKTVCVVIISIIVLGIGYEEVLPLIRNYLS